MEIGQFWDLVSLVGGYPPESETSFQSIENALAALREGEIVAFEDLLAELLYDLDRREFAAVHTTDTGREQSSDSFIYNRCAVVVAGRIAFEAVLRGDESFARFTHSHVASSEPLLYVAEKAYKRATGRQWDHVSPFDYETGSNSAGWA